MKGIVAKFVILVVGVLSIGAQIGSAQNPIVEQLRSQWEASRKQMVQVAEAMPADKFQFQPTPEVRGYGSIITHLAGENMTFMETVAGGAKPGPAERFEQLKTRPEILKALADSYEYGAKALAGLTDQKAMEAIPFFGGRQVPRWVIVMQAIGHSKEHYGNLVTYLRLNKIVPPSTAGM